ncbi:MAG: phosphotransferase family protein [Ilumatobacteraceae bacterium]
MPPSTADQTSMENTLAELIAEVLGDGPVTELRQLSGGASRETWQFATGGRSLILQRQRSGDVRDMSIEVAVLRAAHAGGVPVPNVIAASSDVSELGAAYMVLTHVEGETIARKILRDDAFAEARAQLAADCAVALVGLHSIDPATVPQLAATDQIDQYRTTLDTLGYPHPTFELTFRWLESNRPTTDRLTVVHGDFRLGNLMVGPEGLRAVLDWELAHIGDPMEDLGWLCVKAWRFGSPKPVAGVGEYADLFDAYAAASGTMVDPDVVRWWEVLGTLKWGIMCILQAQAHLAGSIRSHEMAAIGRRVCENEHDLFLALDGHW